MIRRRHPIRVTLDQVRAWERKPRKPIPVRRWGLDPELARACYARDGGCVMRPELGGDRPGPASCYGRLDPHHVLPRGRGGADELSNLVTLCRAHHDWVHAHPSVARPAGLLR
jgi:5-methylcytosine-specific restriction endonuclease McrA